MSLASRFVLPCPIAVLALSLMAGHTLLRSAPTLDGNSGGAQGGTMTSDQVMKMPKIDAHAHIATPGPGQLDAFLTFLERNNLRWLNICVGGMDWTRLKRRIELAQELHRSHPGRIAWATSFGLTSWGKSGLGRGRDRDARRRIRARGGCREDLEGRGNGAEGRRRSIRDGRRSAHGPGVRVARSARTHAGRPSRGTAQLLAAAGFNDHRFRPEVFREPPAVPRLPAPGGPRLRPPGRRARRDAGSASPTEGGRMSSWQPGI